MDSQIKKAVIIFSLLITKVSGSTQIRFCFNKLKLQQKVGGCVCLFELCFVEKFIMKLRLNQIRAVIILHD